MSVRCFCGWCAAFLRLMPTQGLMMVTVMTNSKQRFVVASGVSAEVCQCVFHLVYYRAIRPCHANLSMLLPLVLPIPLRHRWLLLRKPMVNKTVSNSCVCFVVVLCWVCIGAWTCEPSFRDEGRSCTVGSIPVQQPRTSAPVFFSPGMQFLSRTKKSSRSPPYRP